MLRLRMQLMRIKLSAQERHAILRNNAWPSDSRPAFYEYGLARAWSKYRPGAVTVYGCVVLPFQIEVHQDINAEPKLFEMPLPPDGTEPGSDVSAGTKRWLDDIIEHGRGALGVQVTEVVLAMGMEPLKCRASSLAVLSLHAVEAAMACSELCSVLQVDVGRSRTSLQCSWAQSACCLYSEQQP